MSLSRRTFLLVGLVSAFFTSNSPSLRAGEGVIAPGNLTVTVEEQGDGSVRFTLSGTAYMLQDSDVEMDTTNYSSKPGSPPFSGRNEYDLPLGLTLTVPIDGNPSAPESLESLESPVPTKILEIDTLSASNRWTLGYFEGMNLKAGDAITGSGTVTTSAVPFTKFTPGTFLIKARTDNDSESESSVSETTSENIGIFPYSITYKVIPHVVNPSLAVSGPGVFPKTILRKTSRAQQVMITNNGSAPLTDLNFSIAGRGARDFSSSTLSRTSLPSGSSTLVDVRFRPKRKGQRTATLTVNGFYTPPVSPEGGFDGSVEENGAEPVMIPAPTPVAVSGMTTLTGQGIPAANNRRPLSPRFPRGRR